MLSKINKKHKIRALFFFFAIIVVVSFILIDKAFFYNNTKKTIIENGFNQITERENIFKGFIHNSENILNAIRNSKNLNNVLKNPNDENILSLEDLFKIVIQSNSNFMQLRYINKDGLEVVRIDRENEFGDIFKIKNENLQDKSNRYYFTNSKTKELEKVWFSDLDLNKENNKVQVPFNPTLRAILPIKHDDKFDGILIINYFMKDFLKKFMHTSLYDMILLDSSGNTIKHYDDKKSWGLFTKEKFNISNEFPNYKIVLNSKFFQNEDFLSKKLDLPINNNLILLLQPSKKYIDEEVYKHNLEYLTIAIIVVILAFIGSYFASNIVSALLNTLAKNEKLTKKLKELNNQLSTILSTTKDCISIIDKDTNFKFVNTASVETTKYSENELLNMNLLSIVANEEKEKFNKRFLELLNKKYTKNFELMCIDKNATLFILSISLVLMPNNEEILLMAKDITQLKEQEQELKTKEQILMHQSKMAAMGEMIESIAHQWRQPLSMISTNVTGLQLKKEYNQLDEDTLDDILISIHEATKHLSQTIDDFRSFFENDKSAETFKLLNIIEKSIFLTSSKFNNRAIVIKLECPDIEITGLSNELVQILMNILNNAKDQLEKIPTTELRLLIIEAYKDSEVAQINITDNGGGVDEDIMPKIFDAYITSKGKNGTGIGLYMSKIMVESHMKGTLRVINKEFEYEGKMHKGACFNIQLPLKT